MGWLIAAAIWNLGFTIFDVINAVEYYQKDVIWAFWLFVIGGVAMFVFFIVTLIAISKEC